MLHSSCSLRPPHATSYARRPSPSASLHDLNRDGFLDIAEIEAIYGLHHPHATRHTPQPDLQESKRKVVTDRVLGRLDTNNDGLLSLQEFLAGGMEGLPSFATYKNLGRELGCPKRTA